MVVVKTVKNFIKDMLIPQLESFGFLVVLLLWLGLSSCCVCHLLQVKGTLFFSNIHQSECSGPGEALLPSRSVVPHRNGDLLDELVILHFAIWFDICFPEEILHCNKSQ